MGPKANALGSNSVPMRRRSIIISTAGLMRSSSSKKALPPAAIREFCGDPINCGGLPVPPTTLGTGIGLDQLFLPRAGSFQTGNPYGNGDERPIQIVNITEPFYIKRTK